MCGKALIDLIDFGFTGFKDVQAIASQTGSGVVLEFDGGDTLLIGGPVFGDLSVDDVLPTALP